MKIKIKILSGFVLVIAMLVIAGFMTIYEFSNMGKSVNSLIEDNYKTIEASKTMLEGLEREDSGILLLMSGHWKEGNGILNSGDSLFSSAFNVAKNNITEIDEDKFIEQIENKYQLFKEIWQQPIAGTAKENDIDWYFTDVHSEFLEAKTSIKALMTLNQDKMHQESKDLKDRARRAIMPGLVAIITALVFLILFNFFITLYLVKPIGNLKDALTNFNSNTKIFDAGITTNDEFKDLEKEIQNFIYKIK